MRWGLALLACLVASCTSLPYSDDVGFLVSAQADSPEFPVYVNGHLCTDMEGNPGLCSKRITSAQDLTLSFDPQQYAYLLTISCPSGIPAIAPASVEAGQPYSFTLPKELFSAYRTFVCIGQVNPQDRTPPISAKFEVTVVVVDAAYSARERAYLMTEAGLNYLVLGQFARNAWVYDGAWAQHNQEPVVRIYGDPSKVKAYSESYADRFNYLNMGDGDGGVIHEPVAVRR